MGLARNASIPTSCHGWPANKRRHAEPPGNTTQHVPRSRTASMRHCGNKQVFDQGPCTPVRASRRCLPRRGSLSCLLGAAGDCQDGIRRKQVVQVLQSLCSEPLSLSAGPGLARRWRLESAPPPPCRTRAWHRAPCLRLQAAYPSVASKPYRGYLCPSGHTQQARRTARVSAQPVRCSYRATASKPSLPYRTSWPVLQHSARYSDSLAGRLTSDVN